MDRYHDNISPEPTNNDVINYNECYKTPNLQNFNFNSIFPTFNSTYPTPPSENDENSPLMTIPGYAQYRNDSYMTPKFENYYGITNKSNDQSAYAYNINQSFDENISNNSPCNNEEKKNSDEKSVQSASVTSKYKRRSRTTYTKHQLDTLEATFQKTHYPEIRVVDDLCDQLKLSVDRVSIWFQNRRARFKKARKIDSSDSSKLNDSIGYQASEAPTQTSYPTLNQACNTSYPLVNKTNNVNPSIVLQEDSKIVPCSVLNYPYLNTNSVQSSNNVSNYSHLSQYPSSTTTSTTSFPFYQSYYGYNYNNYNQMYNNNQNNR
jgi:hypothetical protein